MRTGYLTASHKGTTGYIVSWCLGALAVISVLLYAAQLRHNATQRQNIAVETRTRLEQQFSLIRTTLSDCANQTARAVNHDLGQPTIAKRRPPAHRHYPHMLVTANPRSETLLSTVLCPANDGFSPAQAPLFKTDSLQVPSGFLPWQYSNLESVGDVRVFLTAQADHVPAQQTLNKLFDRIKLADPDNAGPGKRWQLEAQADNTTTLTLIISQAASTP